MAAATAPDLVNRNTVYVRNIDSRVKIPKLVETLKNLFQDYGTIIDIHAKPNPRMQGQAFVTFSDEQDAARAISDVDGFSVFGKPLDLALARSVNDKIASKHLDEAQLERHRRQRKADKDQRIAALGIADKAKTGNTAAASAKSRQTTQGNSDYNKFLPPNRTLQVFNLPEGWSKDELSALFGRFPQLEDVRAVPGRPHMAFVEYESTEGAIAAKRDLDRTDFGSQALEIYYLPSSTT